MAIACFKESGLGKFREDDKVIFGLKPARIRRESDHDETIPPDHMPACQRRRYGLRSLRPGAEHGRGPISGNNETWY
jgi:hypothetical protein